VVDHATSMEVYHAEFCALVEDSTKNQMTRRREKVCEVVMWSGERVRFRWECSGSRAARDWIRRAAREMRVVL
jgi:hypothetical protein